MCKDPEGQSCNSGIYGDACTKGNGQPGCWVEDCGSEDTSDICNGTVRCGTINESNGRYATTSPPTKCGKDRDTGEQLYDVCGCSASAPNAPLLTYPNDGGTVSTDTVTFQWQHFGGWGTGCPINNNQYRVYVKAQGQANFQQVASTTNLSYNWTDPQAGGSYTWYVRADNGARTADSDQWDFTLSGLISGTVYDDPNRQAVLVGGVCTLSGANPVQPGAGSSVLVDAGAYTGAVNGSGAYSVTVPAGPGHVATLVADPEQWSFTCPAGGSYSTESPKNGLNYFVTNVRDAWFQVTGG